MPDPFNEIIADHHMMKQLLDGLLQSISNPWIDLEGMSDEPACFFCGCLEMEMHKDGITYGHTRDCPWVMAMSYMNYPLLNHAVYLGRIEDETT